MLHNSFIKYCIVVLIVMMAFGTQAKKKEKVKVDPSYAWTMSDPLGLQYPAGIDTLYENYHDNAIPYHCRALVGGNKGAFVTAPLGTTRQGPAFSLQM